MLIDNLHGPGSLPAAQGREVRHGSIESRQPQQAGHRPGGLAKRELEQQPVKVLAEHAGDVVSRDKIMQTVNGHAITVTDRAIDAHIARLRKKITSRDGCGSLIRTVHGAGYSLAAEVCAE